MLINNLLNSKVLKPSSVEPAKQRPRGSSPQAGGGLHPAQLLPDQGPGSGVATWEEIRQQLGKECMVWAMSCSPIGGPKDNAREEVCDHSCPQYLCEGQVCKQDLRPS